MSRPRKELDPAQVEALARIGCTYEEMAAVLGCSAKTLQRRYVHLIESGRRQGHASLRRKQWELALKGDRTMLIWLGKQELAQRDRHDHEVAGRDGEPIRQAVEVTVTRRIVPAVPAAEGAASGDDRA